jgi:hypothetical protein
MRISKKRTKTKTYKRNKKTKQRKQRIGKQRGGKLNKKTKQNASKLPPMHLLPILEPKYNMREITKNMLLLEDHLFQRNKRCNQCIKKHFLTVEALAEEMITLDKNQECKNYYQLPDQIRVVEKDYLRGYKNPDNYIKVAQKVRDLRKTMVKDSFSCFE